MSSQSGISGTQLAYGLGINVNSARLFLRKLRTIVDFENNKQMLEGFVDIDGAYMGGVDRGNKRGKGSKKKTILVAQELSNKIYPGMAKLAPCKSENGEAILAFVQKYIKKGSTIHSDKGKFLSQRCFFMKGRQSLKVLITNKHLFHYIKSVF